MDWLTLESVWIELLRVFTGIVDANVLIVTLNASILTPLRELRIPLFLWRGLALLIRYGRSESTIANSLHVLAIVAFLITMKDWFFFLKYRLIDKHFIILVTLLLYFSKISLKYNLFIL